VHQPTTSDAPTRGDIWLLRLPSARGAELQRDRPVVVISSPVFNDSPVRIIVPLTSWKSEYVESINKLLISASDLNGLHEDSAADFLQVRSVSLERFLSFVGRLDAEQVEEIVAGIVISIDYQP